MIMVSTLRYHEDLRQPRKAVNINSSRVEIDARVADFQALGK